MYRQLRGIKDPEEFEARLKELQAEEEAQRAAMAEAWDNLVLSVLEALKIPALCDWLADKIEKITGKK